MVPIYILDWIFCFFRTSSNCLFASASNLRHISWLSGDSCLHASAIACPGDLGCRRVGFFLEICGTGGFEAIWPLNEARKTRIQLEWRTETGMISYVVGGRMGCTDLYQRHIFQKGMLRRLNQNYSTTRRTNTRIRYSHHRIVRTKGDLNWESWKDALDGRDRSGMFWVKTSCSKCGQWGKVGSGMCDADEMRRREY